MDQTKLYLIVVSLGLLAQAGLSQSVEWPSYNGDLSATRFSPLSEINPGNVNNLRAACTYDTGETTAFQSGLLMVQDVIYFSTYATTYAVDASTCALKWKYSRPGPTRRLGVNRGVAYLDGKLFRGSGDAHIFALDAETGQLGWEATLGDPADAESVPMAPIAWNGIVFAGNAGGDNFGVTGRIYAFSAADGHELWRFHVVPDSGPARATWKNLTDRNPPTGGATWTTYSLDPGAEVLWVSTGNVAPDFLLTLHPGDNLYTTSVVALDAKTGKLLRYVQPVKKDFHDWDMTSPPALIRTSGGRQIAAAAGKDGLLYGIDRSGVAAGGKSSQRQLKILYATPVTTRANVQTPLNANTETHFCPGTQGGTEWNGPAFHPMLNLLFVNAVDWCASVKIADAATVTGKRGSAWAGSGDPQHAFGRADPKESWGGWLTAVDADTGRVRWKYKSPTPMLAAVTPTAGGVVFTGDLNGDVLALDASSGSVLWRNATGAALGGGVISYQTGGHQRVAVVAGMSPANWPVPRVTGRVIVYALP
ncbi:MAG TPA: PQQ-binding-like beta-propeller repeat protein [Bryobacteraceae bacterium]|jgi:alcohol dehydrogenase (cytochrome c)|nr:PQQ-binding-like beta-propeller repeat protein [Bryobacteraceae bacterium]